MDILIYAPWVILFFVGMMYVTIMASDNNQLRLAAWLEAHAKAQAELRVAKAGIEEERRLYQRRRETALLRREHLEGGKTLIEIGKG